MLGHNLPLETLFPWTANYSLGPLGSLGAVHANTILLSWICMLLILAMCALVTPRMVVEGPGGGGQGIMEMLYSFLKDIAKGQIGHEYRTFFPLVAAIFIFVLIANFSGILPWKLMELIPGWPQLAPHEPFEVAAPTTDFNVTFGLALVALLTYLGAGFWAHKAGYLKLYLNPIEWLDLIIRPATLSLRLMMVITADELMRGAALLMVPFILPAGVMGFEMFIAVLQAFVFCLLTSIYIGLTVSHH